MTAGAPWSVKGINPKAREVAKDHARRSGMTLGEWLNRVILEDEAAAAEALEPPPPPLELARVFPEPARPRLVAETPQPRRDEVVRIADALDRLTDRLEASETRTGLAISGVEHSVRQALARIETGEREHHAVAARFETAVERVGGEQARLVERLRRMETEAVGPRSTEALRVIEQSVSRTAGQVYDLEARLARAEARAPADTTLIVEEMVERLGQRLASAESHTAEALDGLRRSLATLDGRLRSVEGGRASDDTRFEALARTLAEQVEGARGDFAERLKDVDAGRIDRRFAELTREVSAAEQRSAEAVRRMGHEMLSMADAVNRRLQNAEERSAESIAHVGAEMGRVAGAMEARLNRAEQTHAESLERLSAELGRITDKLSERLLIAERRAAEAIDDVGDQVGRISDRIAETQARSAQELSDKIRESEGRTAQLLEDAHARLERRLSEAQAAPLAAAPPEPEPPESSIAEPSIPEPSNPELAPAPVFAADLTPAPTPSILAAFRPELFLRAEDSQDSEADLELTEVAPAQEPAPSPMAARFDGPHVFAPIPEPEEDLFGLDQPEPPTDAEVNPALSTREVIEQARAAARAAAPAEAGDGHGANAKPRQTWYSGGMFGGRPRRAPSTTLQTALMVAGGAAFLSVGAAGVVLMQGPSARQPSPEAPVVAAAVSQGAPRAAVALAPASLGQAQDPSLQATPRQPAQLADALLTAFATASKGVEADEPGALAKLRAIAEAGHAPAQFYLGKLYETGGHGVPQNFTEARRWTARAAAAGDAAAMHNMALFNFRGEGGPQDLAGAARWFRAAAEQGIVDSQYNLGLLYQSGSGVPADPAQAYAWFSIAGVGGDAQARANALALRSRLSPNQLLAAGRTIDAYSPSAAATLSR